MANDLSQVPLDNKLIRKFLTSDETLQSDAAAPKSGATGGSSSQSLLGAATLPEAGSIVSSKDPLAKQER